MFSVCESVLYVCVCVCVCVTLCVVGTNTEAIWNILPGDYMSVCRWFCQYGSRIMSLIKSVDFQFESMISFLFSDTAPSCAQILAPHSTASMHICFKLQISYSQSFHEGPNGQILRCKYWPQIGFSLGSRVAPLGFDHIWGYMGSIYMGTTSVGPPWNMLTHPLGTHMQFIFNPHGAYMEMLLGFYPAWQCPYHAGCS